MHETHSYIPSHTFTRYTCVYTCTRLLKCISAYTQICIITSKNVRTYFVHAYVYTTCIQASMYLYICLHTHITDAGPTLLLVLIFIPHFVRVPTSRFGKFLGHPKNKSTSPGPLNGEEHKNFSASRRGLLATQNDVQGFKKK
jgi:hypothetical protein